MALNDILTSMDGDQRKRRKSGGQRDVLPVRRCGRQSLRRHLGRVLQVRICKRGSRDTGRRDVYNAADIEGTLDYVYLSLGHG